MKMTETEESNGTKLLDIFILPVVGYIIYDNCSFILIIEML